MGTSLLVALAGVVGVVATALGGYLVARRKSSGTIDTTEAETLWAQSNALLDRYKSDLADCRAEAVVLRSEIIGLRDEVARFRTEAKTLAAEVSRKLAADVAGRLAAEVARELASHDSAPGNASRRQVAAEVASRLAGKVLDEATSREEEPQ